MSTASSEIGGWWRVALVGLILALGAACGGGGDTKAVTGAAATSESSTSLEPSTTVAAAPAADSAASAGPTPTSTATSVALTPAFTAPAPAGATTVPTPTTLAPAATPTLRILSPQSGDVVAAPVAVQYSVTGFDVGPGKGALQLTLGDGGSFGVSLALDGPSGVVYLDDKRLSGARTLVFTLITAGGQPLTNPEATVRIPNVTLEGRK